MLKTVIIEDELPAYNRLKNLILEVEPHTQIISHADSIKTAVEIFNTFKDIDLAFFDIELADGQSFEIFNETEVYCPVIFTTAYDEYALKAFKINSIDYLLKPIDIKELKFALDKFKKQHSHQADINNTNIVSLIQQLGETTVQKYKTRFLVKLGERLIPVSASEIAYFYSREKLTHLITHQNNHYITEYTIEQLSKILEPKNFFQLNRQVISSISGIKQINTYFSGKLKITLNPVFNEDVIVSRERTPLFKQWLSS